MTPDPQTGRATGFVTGRHEIGRLVNRIRSHLTIDAYEHGLSGRGGPMPELFVAQRSPPRRHATFNTNRRANNYSDDDSTPPRLLSPSSRVNTPGQSSRGRGGSATARGRLPSRGTYTSQGDGGSRAPRAGGRTGGAPSRGANPSRGTALPRGATHGGSRAGRGANISSRGGVTARPADSSSRGASTAAGQRCAGQASDRDGRGSSRINRTQDNPEGRAEPDGSGPVFQDWGNMDD